MAAYIHRVGRTARYVATGRALLLLLPSEKEGLLQQVGGRWYTWAMCLQPGWAGSAAVTWQWLWVRCNAAGGGACLFGGSWPRRPGGCG